ncbi:MAG: 3-deoxy-D-arabinoheptulosonate-7-phosphate synthase [Deltaproteobacteria bacterium]|nr:3-deoxy-D-arabinoheptulosonate-7-phosphate synthase [Deltaproteobacteria bacterium]
MTDDGNQKRAELDARVLRALGARLEYGPPSADERARASRLAEHLGVDVGAVEALMDAVAAGAAAPGAGDGADESDRVTEPGAPPVVAYQGIEASYSHAAATRHFARLGLRAELRGYPSFRDMLEDVRDGAAAWAVLPLENTTAGSIHEAYDLLASMGLAIVGEEVQRVDHCLVASPGATLESLRSVWSHPQALAQCRDFLAALPHVEPRAYADTAGSVRKVHDDGDVTQAALGSETAAERYGLTVLRRNVADQPDNFTRMLVVAREAVPIAPGVPSKTSLLLATRHEQGALAACLNVLASHGLSLTKLQSRPRPGSPFEYLFYLDFEGAVGDPSVDEAIVEVRARTSSLIILGSYPSAAGRRGERLAEAFTGGDAPAVAVPRRGPGKKALDAVGRGEDRADTVVQIGADVRLGGAETVVFAGPTLVESREQIRDVARVVKDAGAQVLWGGCFEPRASGYFVEGRGFDALAMLEEAGREIGLPIATEVARPGDVGKVARRVDLLVVSERHVHDRALLDAVGQVDKPVLLKRGAMASVEEWLAAAEHIAAKGKASVVLCERGVRTMGPGERRTLDLSVIPQLRETTHLPIVVDPTSAVGVRRRIAPLCAAAIAAGAHGLLLDVHPDPANALGGGEQALTFDMFRALMRAL